ncbi:MAG: amidohydrolase family protein [Pseudomonadota bacterium]
MTNSPPSTADWVITNATIITVDAERRVLTEAALAVTGDKISWIGASDAAAQISAATRIDGRDKVLTPGFINAHVHITGDPLTRHFMPDDLNDPDRLFTWVIPRYYAHTPEDERLSALFCSLELLKGGSTTFLEAGTICHLDHAADGVREAGIRARIGGWVEGRAFDPDQDEAQLIDAAIKIMQDGVAKLPQREDDLIAAWPILVGHNTNPDAVWQAAKHIADDAGVGVAGHMSPYNADPEWYLKQVGARPMVHLEALGALGENVTITHATHIDQSEVDVFAHTGTNIAYCPFASLKGAFHVSKVAHYNEARDAGVNIAFATDGYDPELLQAARIGVGIFKDLTGDVGPANVMDGLEAITINGAKALGLDHMIGSLEVGKQADILAFDTRNAQWRPLISPIDQLIFSADGRSLESVWVAGRQLIKGGEVLHVDEDALLDQVQRSSDAILERCGLPFRRSWPTMRAS